MKLKAAIFDWAGTMVDHGSLAPMGAFVKVFADFNVTLSINEARGPMGRPKWDHIKALLENSAIAARWQAAHGEAPSTADIDRIYQVFVPLNASVVTDFADVIPGVIETHAVLRERGMRIGSTTGYTREIMERLLPAVATQGLALDNLVCAGDLSMGRPTPAMMYKCFLDLGVWPASSVVKIDDTDVGIEEGLHAGCWTVGVSMSGNALGLSLAELQALSPEARVEGRTRATSTLKRAGAHEVIDSVADLLPVIDRIEGRMARGERP